MSLILAILTFLHTFLPLPTYTEGVVGQPLNFNPPEARSNEVDKDISSLIFRGLTKYNSKGEVVPDLAESWQVSEDGLSYTVKIKEGERFDNGKKITADDIIFSASQSRELKNITTDKLDNRTVRFTLKTKFSPFLSVLTTGIAPANTPPSAIRPVGSGPFRIVKVDKNGLVREVWLETKSKEFRIKRLVFKFYASEEELKTAIRLGEIDGYGGFEAFNWPHFKPFPLPMPSRYYGIFFNLKGKNELIKEADFRRKLAGVTPKEQILKEAANEHGVLVSGPIYAPWLEGQDIQTYGFNPNPERTYEGKTITLTVPDLPVYLKIAALIKSSWEKTGLTVNVEKISLDNISERILKNHDFEAVILGQEVGRDPDRYSLWHSTQINYPGLNITSFESPRVDRALEEGRKTESFEERIKHYVIFARIIAEEVPAIYLYQPIYTYNLSERIKGVNFEGFFTPRDRFMNLKDWFID